MRDQRSHTSVTVLEPPEWAERLGRAGAPLPFSAPPWIELGLTETPDLVFQPVAMRCEGAGELLVPLCLLAGRPGGSASAREARIGCFGYGVVCPSEGWRRDRLPDFPALAGTLGRAMGLTGLDTLLPPKGTVSALDTLTGHWAAEPGRDTFLLDLSQGLDRVWATAMGRCRTAVRKARALGLRPAAGRPEDTTALLRLRRETLGRNGAPSAVTAKELAFLLDGSARGREHSAVTLVVRDGEGPLAASVFALGTETGFHIMQLTSQRGRTTNAGHLAFWEAVSALARRGVTRLDLGSAAGEGQRRFKTGWGARASAPRVVRWQEESP